MIYFLSHIGLLVILNIFWKFGQVGMLFVRCRGGVSHSPAEHVLDDDVWAAGLAILSFLESQL